MRYLITILFVCSFFMLRFIMVENQNDKSVPGREVVNELLLEIATSFEKKYSLHPIGTNVAMPGG